MCKPQTSWIFGFFFFFKVNAISILTIFGVIYNAPWQGMLQYYENFDLGSVVPKRCIQAITNDVLNWALKKQM